MRYFAFALALLGLLCFGAAIFVRGVPAMTMAHADAANGKTLFQLDLTGITQGILWLVGSGLILVATFVSWRTRASAN
jgi:hypothetical protein